MSAGAIRRRLKTGFRSITARTTPTNGKLANLPFVGVVLAVILLNPVFKRRRIAPALICLLTALLPILLWMWWCQNQFGDLTGTSGKLASLTWTRKPIGQWWSHPIFTARGTWIFLSALLARFWRG